MNTSKTLSLLLLLSAAAHAQETPGLVNSNYFVSSAFVINPSASADSKTFMQYNLVAGDAYLGNNLVFLPHFKWSLPALQSALSSTPGIDMTKRPKFAAAMASVEGPAFVISKNNFGLGFFVRARAEADFKLGSMYEAASLLVQDLQNAGSTDVNIRNTRAAAMAWTELGLNYSYLIKKTRKSTLSVGANLKALLGAGYAFANLKTISGWYNDSIVQVNTFNSSFKYSMLNYQAGKGLGLDIGLTYKKMLGNAHNYFSNSVRCNCEQMNYHYLFSLSLHDVGLMRFKNANLGSYETTGTFYTGGKDTTYLKKISELQNLSFRQKNIFASLPSELVARFDYNFNNGIYTSATVYKNLVHSGLSGVRGSNLFQVAPRFEHKLFEFSVPLSFIDFKKPITGAFMRVGTFGIGIDNIAPLLYKSNVSKAGVYFKWSVSLNKNPACKQKKYKPVECPTKILSTKK